MPDTYRVEIHGISNRGRDTALLMKVGDISPYINLYDLPETGLDKESLDAIAMLHGVDCPRKERWDADCDGSHKIVDTVAELIRGNLKEPARGGEHQGKQKDPSKDYNYWWKVVRIQGVAVPSTLPERASNGTGGTSMEMPHGDKVTLNRELATNDRTALMQAVARNLPTEVDTLDAATLFSTWLNERSVARMTSPLVQAAQSMGANVVEVKPKPKPEPEPSDDPPKPVVKTAEELDRWITVNKVDLNDVRISLTTEGYDNSKDYLTRNPEGGYQGLADHVYKFITDGKDEEPLPW